MSEAKRRKGIPFVIAAPSGTGKTTICRMLLERDPLLRLSVSHTTRAMRSSETNAVDYHFVSEDDFNVLVAKDAFLEWARFSNNLYGTSLAAIESLLGKDFDPLLEIEVQGAGQVRERRADACLIFLLPPSLQMLEDRLRGRATDSDDEIRRRLGEARGEIERARIFDYAVINGDLEGAVAELILLLASIRRARGCQDVASEGDLTDADTRRLEAASCQRVLADWRAGQGERDGQKRGG
jgi:guanylate kinase